MLSRASVPIVTLALASLAHAADLPPLDEAFNPGSKANWTLDTRNEGTFAFPAEGAGGAKGLKYSSQGLEILSREWSVGAAPFELTADVTISQGLAETWRNSGVVIALSSALPDRMTDKDWAVLFSPVQQGMIASARRGGTRFGKEVRPNVWNLSGHDVAPRFTLTMGGGGGHDYSAAWPSQNVAGTTLRFHAWRDSQQVLRFTVYHSDGAAGPWWEGQATIPKELQNVPLRYLVLHTAREAEGFSKPATPVSKSAFHTGSITRIAARQLAADEKPTLNVPLPAATAPAQPRPSNAPLMYAGTDLAKLREKWSDKAFSGYRKAILKAADKVTVDGNSSREYGSPGQGQYFSCLAVAYAMTDDKKYLDALLPEFDAIAGVTDKLPALASGNPGHRRQLLDMREFMGHNICDLAMAYDLLGDKLDQPRRDRARFMLARAVRNYLDRIARGDWWYANNPSNTIGVAAGTMGLCALALRYDDPELSKQGIDTAIKTLGRSYVAIRPDGSCIEGTLYWVYGQGFPLLLGNSLRNVSGNDRGIFETLHLKNAVRYVENSLGGDGTQIPFNDTQPWLNGWLICALAGREYDQPLMRWVADTIADQINAGTYTGDARGTFAICAFLYRDYKPAPATFPGVPTLSTLAGVQEGVMRSDGGFIPRLVTGVKGKGDTATHHANQDQGSFVLYARGEFFLIDPGYFDGGPDCHSLPLIGDPKTFKATAVCPISNAWEAGSLRSMSVDATAAYGAAAKKARRVFVQVADKALVVVDDLEPADAKATVTAQYQTGFATEAAGASATVTGKDAAVQLATFGPELNLAAKPRKFTKEWIFSRRPGVNWHTVSAAYTVDPARPLVTLISVRENQNPTPTVKYAEDKIEVTLGAEKVAFTRVAGKWSAVKP